MKIVVIVLTAALAGYWIYAAAQTRIDVRPALTPMGTSATDGVSFAWFYDSSDRSVYVCRAGKGVSGTVDCKARTKLP